MKQRGISLIVVLVALLIIGFAAVALLRSSDTSTLTVGNLAFKRTALAAGDAGTEAAITWLADNATSATLFDDSDADGYYATSADACDLTGTRTPADATDDVNWTGTDPGGNCNMDALTLDAGGAIPDGYTVSYVVNRMCNAAGDPGEVFAADHLTPMVCSSIGAGISEGSTRSAGSYGVAPLAGETQNYYRITTRIDGPRNTVRYIQVLVTL
ncbi:MAG: type II secretion system protein [Steroidobacteraceae bacterium]